ncbi:hypothetical protein PV10_00236 [Exophiala mesophila]|uniref:Protein YTP1-like C-terminal domain-containing protein n=1 Tax=Exophiala mesophila TaxID=212818 RepID=A0A0D1X3G1_EXOME|nr:uncharacterized protein PV10_00236 [Exophiala mesophila]KIV96355.1 hypothetical protein PV10_00236 [Exophiala mesophila]
MAVFRVRVAVALLQLASVALAHGDDHTEAKAGVSHGDMSNMPQEHSQNQTSGKEINNFDAPSYYGLESHSNLMLAHIVLMVSAWFFVLPFGVVFSVAKSRFALPTQFVFLVLNGLGVLFGTVYNVNTPDLYVNNAHHKMGWIATWVMTAQVVMGLLFTYAGRGQKASGSASEREVFLPGSVASAKHYTVRPYADHRWSGDSGQGTECSSNSNSRDVSPTDRYRRDTFDDFEKPEPIDPEDDDASSHSDSPRLTSRASWFRFAPADKWLSARMPNMLSKKALSLLNFGYDAVDRIILPFGFVVLTSGGVTYAGIFRGENIFGGLAHFIKGGIFFWYGLLTLGRWMGCFAELGWAWNVKPGRHEVSQWKFSMPSAEFVESSVIFVYGCTNVFLEHLAAWGDAWTAQDLEHVSISIMFFGGGLCGMLVESKAVRRCLNFSVETLPAQYNVEASEAHELRPQPRTYGTSLNPLPALIIMLLGIMMSAHHQSSVVSTMVHKQWGNLLVGFSFARMATYLLTYISPPTSLYASRPPTELVSAFCLISGGLVFMASNKDIVHYIESADLMAMFVFTVVMGLTAFIMSYEIIVLSLKGWAARKEQKAAPSAIPQ